MDPAQSRQFVKGDKFYLDGSGMVLVQGAVINALACWEEFIVEILKEGFMTFVEVGSGSPPTLHSLKKSLPSCDVILRYELRHSCQIKPADEKMFSIMGLSTQFMHLFTNEICQAMDIIIYEHSYNAS